MHKFDDAGLKNIWLVNGFEEKRTPYGKAVAYHDVEGLTRAICKALSMKPARLSGVEFRYLRQHLRMSQSALAKFFGNTEQAVALWERTGRVPKWADKMIRLIWRAREEGNEPIQRAIDRLNDIDRLLNQRIVLEETRRGWKTRIEEEPEAA